MGRGGTCNQSKNVLQSMLHQQCLFKLQNAIKKIISIQARGGLIMGGGRAGDLQPDVFFVYRKMGFYCGGGGGLIPVNGGGGNNWKFTVTCQKLLNY